MQGAVGLCDVDGARQYFVVQGEGCFDQPCNTGGSFGVADLRFHTAQGDVVQARIVFTKNAFHRFGFRGVACAGTGTVCFDETNG